MHRRDDEIVQPHENQGRNICSSRKQWIETVAAAGFHQLSTSSTLIFSPCLFLSECMCVMEKWRVLCHPHPIYKTASAAPARTSSTINAGVNPLFPLSYFLDLSATCWKWWKLPATSLPRAHSPMYTRLRLYCSTCTVPSLQSTHHDWMHVGYRLSRETNSSNF